MIARGSISVSDEGDVFIGGEFLGSVDLDPTAGVHFVNNSAGQDVFVVKLTPNGDFTSAYVTEGTGSAAFMDLEVAGDGSIVVGGYFRGTVDFAPGSTSLPLTTFGDRADAVVLKLNSGFSRDWVHKYGGDGETIAVEVEVDQDGYIYLGGAFGRLFDIGPTGLPADFDPGPDVYELVRPSTFETGYALSLTEAGDFRWAVPLGGNSGRAQVQGISVAADGNVHLSGAFKGNADFDPDPAAQFMLNSGTTQSVFVATLTQAEPEPGAPIVDAGENQTILVTAVANLEGTVIDDGLPNPVTTIWSMIGGPGTVTFGSIAALDTTATFSTSGSYLLKLEASDGQFTTADFVNIVVNPSTATLSTTADTYIDNGKATTNFGGSASLIADGKPDDAALLKWELSGIPAGSTLQSARLSVNVTGSCTDSYEIYEIKRNWSELQATWKKANSATNWQSAGAQGSLDRGSTVLGTAILSATGVRSVVLNAAGLAVVQGWVNNPATNFGFILQDYANSVDDDLVISSRNTADAANRPQLHIEYDPPHVAPTIATALSAANSQSTVGIGSTIDRDHNDNSVVKNTRTSAFYAPAISESHGGSNLLTSLSGRNLRTKTKGHNADTVRPTQAAASASMDKAFEEIDFHAWPKIVAEITLET
jgi:hypothetical protein